MIRDYSIVEDCDIETMDYDGFEMILEEKKSNHYKTVQD